METTKLIVDYGKSVSTLFMAVLGVQVTLLGSIFKDAPDKDLAFIGIILMLFASLAALSHAESAIRKIVGPPTFRYNFINKALHGLPVSNNFLYIRSLFGGLAFAASMLCYLMFAYGALAQ